MAARIRGVLANRFARLATFNKHQIDHCQIAGMLSNLGELMVATSMVDPIVDDATQFLPDQIGGAVMALWSLPDPIVEAVVLQRSASALPGSLSPAHILHAVRGLEKHFEECAFEMGPEFSMLGALPDSSVAPDILEKWFNCFCDLHLDLQRAA